MWRRNNEKNNSLLLALLENVGLVSEVA